MSVYLLIEREFINSNTKVYKIGRTNDCLKRIKNYPKGSKLLFTSLCDNHYECENKIKEIFKNKYKQRTDIGLEYFEGDCNEMISDIVNIIFDKNDTDVINNKNSYCIDNDTQTDIVNIIQKKEYISYKMECIFCNKKFLTKGNMIRHLSNKSCKSEMLLNDWVSLYNFIIK